MKFYNFADAVQALAPGAKYEVRGDTYEDIIWLDEDITKPSQADVEAKYAEGLALVESSSYKYSRKDNYPAIGEQLDMLYHAIDGDEGLKTQFNDFYTAIKAVKDANPKPAE